MSQFITTAEAARIIGCNPSRVRQLLIDARIKGQRLGRDWLVDRASAEAYRDSDRRPGPRPNSGGADGQRRAEGHASEAGEEAAGPG